MGKRIKFARNKGVIERMLNRVENPVGASLSEPRVKFKKRDQAYVDNNFEYPVRVTATQLEAIFYRVRDAKLTGGFTVTDDDIPGFNARIQIRDTAPDPNALAEADELYYTVRGHCTFLDSNWAEDPMSKYGSDFFGSPYTKQSAYLLNSTFRDAASELAMWTSYNNGDDRFDDEGFDYPPTPLFYGEKENFSPIGHADVGTDFLFASPGFFGYPMQYFNLGILSTSSEFIGGGACRTAFSLVSENAGAGDGSPSSGYMVECTVLPGSFDDLYGAVEVAFTGEVAFVDVQGNGNPYDPLNKLYPRMEFNVLGFDGNWTYIASARGSSGTPLAETTLTFDFDGSGIPPIIVPVDMPPDFAFDGATITDIDPFVFRATKWWPYADKDGNPVWDENTGARL